MVLPDTRRAARLLAVAWAVSWAGVPISAAFGSVIVHELTRDLALTGIPFFLLYLGSLVSAYPSGRLMDRYGRKPVLIGGHLVAALGFGLGTMAILASHLWLFFLSQFIAAVGAAATYLTRLAAADLYPARERARGLGRLVFMLVIGASASIPLIFAAQRMEAFVGRNFLAFAWGIVPLLSLVAAYLTSRIHPDPMATAHLIQAEEQASEPTAAQPNGRLPLRMLVPAALTLLFAQAAMASLMSVSGAALSHEGHGNDFIISTLVLHILGMFAFSPIVGVIGDRWGRRPLLFLSAAYLLAATLVTRFQPDGTTLIVALVIVGIGWSFAFIGTTAIIADTVPAARRGRVAGFIDFSIAIVGGIASLSAGRALSTGGIRDVATLGILFTVGVLVAATLAPATRAAPIRALPGAEQLGK